jgi:hypothetical protein
VRVVVATSVLPGTFAVASPAAAETAAQCHAAINQYRVKAGLDKASSTSIKALAVAAGKHAAYRVNVDPGDSILLSALGLPDLGLFGPDLNAHLETPSLVGLGFTGVNPWDRTRAAKLAAGTWRYQYEDVTTASGIPAASLQGVRSWIDAPTTGCPCWTPTPATSAARPASGRSAPPSTRPRCWRWPPPGRTRPSGSPAATRPARPSPSGT